MLVAPSREAAARGPAASAAEAASDRAVRAAPPRVVTWVRAVSGRAVSRLRRVGPARAEQPEAAAAEAMREQVGRGPLGQVSNALDNLTISTDPMRKLPPFIVIAVPPGGSDSIGSERGLEYDTLSDRYARYITQEIMPALQTSAKATYPNLKFDPNASGRAALGCSSGGAAAFTMAWFRPDLFSRVIAYSGTF